jgi:hypothetical protein
VGSTAYTRAAYLTFAPGECVLEAGSERGEGSTRFLADLALERGVPFFAIDPDPEVIAVIEAEIPGATAVHARAEDALRDWDGPAPRFAWLDGYDWPYSWAPSSQWLPGQQLRYGARGEVITEEASAASHLAIAELLHPLMPPGAVIGIDDTWLRGHGGWQGKGSAAVPWLTRHGWRLIEHTMGMEPGDGFATLRKDAG